MKNNKIIIINYIILAILFILNIFASVYFFTSNDTSIIFNNNILKVVEIKVPDNSLTWTYKI